ncbi:MAG: dTDP-4-dehydrorhamnose 3,5-epimerase [Gammaproteobacteria bacterium]|jgi:dTDP-4-dehydrorhamnose 3,5-epimerase|nr:dTDP-4-dehydrorhamnose 3,5-epimerase [Gammaproteobacteria bacterium]MDP6094834.1 dTDP-4-dehydrorhamnose 3,5-epimerase family protein [Gammaproteobacteria bacterium]MDP7089230.1 dTDP-4-dehydrorhamnose 3,5-epimerase family protein [Dehalococcoidia bacterium]HJN97282.1 dTDP-4-dehydrorhamnose 3,5-epimerase family protein [Gammaproteobacteria bacterium]|tara:strand:- start:5388 stop:5951 length:564 start_codon:yes stop_codon:yes gene_type:complete
MNRFSIHETPLADLYILERYPLGDERGFLERIFCQEELGSYLQRKTIRQINHTLTRKKGTVRGMHFQRPPQAETKIVTCLQGKVLDVAVDLRKGSPTFLMHHASVLSDENFQSLLIPEGFAHGFQTLTTDCGLLYFHTADYQADAEGGIDALDPRLSIEWPLPLSERSERDSNHPMLTTDFSGIKLS